MILNTIINRNKIINKIKHPAIKKKDLRYYETRKKIRKSTNQAEELNFQPKTQHAKHEGLVHLLVSEKHQGCPISKIKQVMKEQRLFFKVLNAYRNCRADRQNV